MKIQFVDGVFYATYRINGDLKFVIAPTLTRAVAIATFCLYNARA